MTQNNILITGGAGFIGSNFITYFLNQHPTNTIINIDKLTYAGELSNLKDVQNLKNYTFIKEDICNPTTLEDIFKTYKISKIIHFAAESHVDNSIENPQAFINTNILGTYNVLECAKKNWIKKPFELKEDSKNNTFLHISTDEVYGTLNETGFFTENSCYKPNSPYSASKASADMLVRSYFHTYGLPVIITNCSNNYGPKQHDEKLIPTIIRKAIQGEEIPIYGNGKNIRDWLYVLDHCKALDLVLNKGKTGETYLIGANNEKTNLELTLFICSILDELLPAKKPYKEQIQFVEDRAGHDFRYAIDASKIKREIGWQPETEFNSALKKTIQWYLNKYTS